MWWYGRVEARLSAHAMGAAGAWVGAAVLVLMFGASCATHATNHDAATTMLSVSARVFCAVLTLDAVQWGCLVLLLTVWAGVERSAEGINVGAAERYC